MTENQIKYLTLQEAMRHNAATEDVATQNLAEVSRSNRAHEDDIDLQHLENVRSHKVSETQGWTKIAAGLIESTMKLGEKVGSALAQLTG